MARKKPLTAEYLRSRLSYDPATGVFTWLAKPVRTGDDSRWNQQFAGTEAGSANGNGYIRICIDYVHYVAHRLAWLYAHGEWPKGKLDHEDRDRSNNRIANLRPATGPQNGANKTIHRNNSSGHKGASWHKRIGKWNAYIRVDGTLKFLGYFDDKGEAAAVYLAAAKAHFGEFASDGL